MMDEDDRSDNGDSLENNSKPSKRDRFKGALSRTKSKFKRDSEKSKDTEEKEAELPEDVNDFLSAGRTSTSSRTSTGERLRPLPTVSTIDDQTSSPAAPRPPTSEPLNNSLAAQRSPRKLGVPKIDVSNAQRWPRAQTVETRTKEQDINDFLRPEYQGRSQSVTSLSNKPKKERRGRGLSVAFIEAPPVVIGEGGDNAPAPPVEISKARQRARSASPMRSHGHTPSETPTNGAHSKRPSPVPPPPPRQAHALPDVLRPRMLQRVQTGGLDTNGASGLDKEFEMTLRMGSNTTSPVSPGGSPNTPEIVAPKPMRVIQPPPAVFEEPAEPDTHTVKNQLPQKDLRKQFREGDALRMHFEKEEWS